MANKGLGKPSAIEFRKAVRALGGNMTKVAEFFGVSRMTIYKWRDEDVDFLNVIKDERLRLFDEAMSTARVVSLGIPKYEIECDANGAPLVDEDGRPIKRMVGWQVPPDRELLKFFMSTYGKYDKVGFEESDDADVPAVKNGINIQSWIELRNEAPVDSRGKKKKR